MTMKSLYIVYITNCFLWTMYDNKAYLILSYCFPPHNFPPLFSVLLFVHFNEYRDTELNVFQFMFLSYLLTVDA